MPELLRARLLDTYLADVLGRSHALEDLAKRLASAEDYVTPEVPILIQKFAAAAVLIRKAVIEQSVRYRRTGKSADLAFLRSLDRTLQELFLDVRLPERARSDRVPGVLTRLV